MTASTPASRSWGHRERLIAALVPDAARRPTPRTLPLPALPAPTLPRVSDPDVLLIGTARIDRSGRIHERRLFAALGWAAGQELELPTGSEGLSEPVGAENRVTASDQRVHGQSTSQSQFAGRPA